MNYIFMELIMPLATSTGFFHGGGGAEKIMVGKNQSTKPWRQSIDGKEALQVGRMLRRGQEQ